MKNKNRFFISTMQYIILYFLEEVFEVFEVWEVCEVVGVEDFQPLRSKGSISSMGWEFSSADVVFSPNIKEGKDFSGWNWKMLELIPLPYSLFLIPYLLLKHPLPRLKPWAMVNVVIFEIEKCWEMKSSLWGTEVATKNPGCISQPGFFYFSGKGLNIFNPYINHTNLTNFSNLINI